MNRLIAAAFLLLVAIPAAAFPVSVQVVVAGATDFTGDGETTWDLAGFKLEGPDVALDAWFDGHITVTRHTVVVARTADTHPLGPKAAAWEGEQEVVRDERYVGRVEVIAVGGDPVVRWLATAPATGHLVGRQEWQLDPPAGVDLAAPHEPPVSVGAAAAARTTSNLTINGEASLYAFGVVLELDGSTVETGKTDVAGAGDPAGLHTVNQTQYVAATLQGSWVAQPTGDWMFAAKGLTGQLDGDIAWGDATGRVRGDGQTTPNHSSLLQVIGGLDATADLRHGAWSISGDATFLASDGITVAGDRWAHVAVAVAGFSLLAVFAAFTQWGREALSVILGRNVADPLANDNRVQALQLIGQEPGINRSALTDHLGASRATVRHHIRILQRAGYITEHETGGNLTYTLNSGTFHFRAADVAATKKPATEKPAAQAFDVVALLKHPQRDRLFQTVATLGEPTYQEMLAFWSNEGADAIAQDQVSYHGGKLAKAGVLTRRRDAGRVRWGVGIDLDALHAHQARAFLLKQNLLAPYEAVSKAGEANVDTIRDTLRQEMPVRQLRHIPGMLMRLVATGLLEQDGDLYRVATRRPGAAFEPPATA